MTVHQLLPLTALILNVALGTLSVIRNPGGRLNRVFLYFVLGLALWSGGVFMLRRTPDEAAAWFWEVVIHVGVILLPAFYYHFVLIFLDSSRTRRRSLLLAYGIALVFTGLNLWGSPAFMLGVSQTFWGWAPVTGPLYTPFFVFFNAFLLAGLGLLLKASKAEKSSFRRNRGTLIVLGTAASLLGGAVDFLRFIGAHFFPALDHLYPLGIPANMFFALVLGMSIIRYRLFNVTVVVKRIAIYGVLGIAAAAGLTALTRAVEQFAGVHFTTTWLTVPLGVVMALLLSPLGRSLEEAIERMMFSKRQGCYDTVLDLTKRMSSILDFGRLVDTIVHHLVERIPLTHCSLLIRDDVTNSFRMCREANADDTLGAVGPVRPDSRLVEWITRTGAILVKEEAKVNPRIAEFFEGAEAELEELSAAMIVPLKVESGVIGILLLGEKLSGEIFEGQEVELFAVLANQAAISLQNARLYQELGSSNARLIQANRLKSEFLANMSHELRTPLNSVIGFSKVLLNRTDGELTGRQEAYVRSVHNSSTHLLQVINDILDISRIEAGKLDIHPESIDLYEVLEECLDSSASLVRGRPLKLEKEIDLDLPSIHADRKAIIQVVLNLLSNAIKFTATGRIVVRARREGDAVHVSIADTGIGIPADDLPRLFQPFQRLDSSRSVEAGGAGLGLAICKTIIQLHGGRIWAQSRERQGSTFHFTLPLTRN